jgi:glycosyltransferase involved in cell wall biosynthesis
MRRAVFAVAAVCAGATAMSWINLRYLRRPDSTMTDATISVLLPARDEAHRIGPTLRSLAHLQSVFEVLVLDDNSSDNTAELVEQAGLTVIRGTQEPPQGWLGKPWACARLAAAASGDVLVFIDADVELVPDAAVRAAAMLTDVDLVCPYPRQIVTGRLQRLVQPLLQWSWLTFLPLWVAERSSNPLLSAGNGQFLVVRREAYEAAGGHAAVRDQVLEDIALVRQVKAAGFPAAMADGTDIATCHMYADDAEMIAGYTKSLHDAFDVPVVVLLAVLYLSPLVAVWHRRTRSAALLAYAAAVAGRVLVARRTGQRSVDALAHPASIAALVGLYANSVLARRRGTLMWRGRRLT